MLEKKIQEKVIKKLQEKGIEALKTIAISRNGYPDLIFPYKGRFFALEIKQKGGKVKALQAKKIHMLRANKAVAFVLDNPDLVEDVLKLYKTDIPINSPLNFALFNLEYRKWVEIIKG